MTDADLQMADAKMASLLGDAHNRALLPHERAAARDRQLKPNAADAESVTADQRDARELRERLVPRLMQAVQEGDAVAARMLEVVERAIEWVPTHERQPVSARTSRSGSSGLEDARACGLLTGGVAISASARSNASPTDKRQMEMERQRVQTRSLRKELLARERVMPETAWWQSSPSLRQQELLGAPSSPPPPWAQLLSSPQQWSEFSRHANDGSTPDSPPEVEAMQPCANYIEGYVERSAAAPPHQADKRPSRQAVSPAVSPAAQRRSRMPAQQPEMRARQMLAQQELLRPLSQQAEMLARQEEILARQEEVLRRAEQLELQQPQQPSPNAQFLAEFAAMKAELEALKQQVASPLKAELAALKLQVASPVKPTPRERRQQLTEGEATEAEATESETTEATEAEATAQAAASCELSLKTTHTRPATPRAGAALQTPCAGAALMGKDTEY